MDTIISEIMMFSNESFSNNNYNNFLLEITNDEFDKMMMDKSSSLNLDFGDDLFTHNIVSDFWNNIKKEYKKDEDLMNVVSEINYALVNGNISSNKAKQLLTSLKSDINNESKIFDDLTKYVDKKKLDKFISNRMNKNVDELKKIIHNNKLSLTEKEKMVKKFAIMWGKYDKSISDDVIKLFSVYKRKQRKISRIKNSFEKYMTRGIFTKIADISKKFGWTVPKRVILKLVFQYTKLFFSSDSYSGIDARIKILENRITKLEGILKKLTKSTGDEKDIQIYRTRQLIEKNKRSIEKLNNDYIKQHWVPIAVTLILLAVLISIGIYYYKNKKNNK